MQCGIIEVRHLDDALGYACSSDAIAKCFDCGIPVCDAHAESCDLCSETFCSSCLTFHNREQHQKKPTAWADIAGKMKRKRA
jgi:predicted sulfurtransferase